MVKEAAQGESSDGFNRRAMGKDRAAHTEGNQAARWTWAATSGRARSVERNHVDHANGSAMEGNPTTKISVRINLPYAIPDVGETRRDRKDSQYTGGRLKRTGQA